MHLVRRIIDVRNWRSKCVEKTVGFVPTMGALHRGHLSLVRSARSECEFVAATIFVNPTQFGAGEDLSKYPRNEKSDIELLKNEGVDLIFVPNTQELYPKEDRFSVIPPSNFTQRAEATARPTHFAGVATICTKLFNIVQPSYAYFGQKDALQCVAMKQLVADLNIPINIRICPTERESDGLALSSRNTYLSPSERKAAPVVYKGLLAARHTWRQLSSSQQEPISASILIEAARNIYQAEPLVSSVEYISVSDFDSMIDLEFVPAASSSSFRTFSTGICDDDNSFLSLPRSIISVALRIGQVRLIDNLPLRE
uniref:Pantoate--beta-alanine ligase n=1 Tax=Aureoumbra lagunensis TaxID=44058 RepID=A0A7S3NP72_9STRA|mmetsp:Transcript_18215/g.27472  ORF Transcript_18215/g.27472 Transcript_18215/m.27472 type:complete len:312 (+) Transcript_18215:10-945(+)